MPNPQHRPESRRPPREAGCFLFALAGVLALFTAASHAGAGGHWDGIQFWLVTITATLAVLGGWRRRPVAMRFRSLRHPNRSSSPESAQPATQAPVGATAGLDEDGAGDA